MSADRKPDHLVLSKGAVVLFSVGYLLLAAIGGFGWNELSGFRKDTNDRFDEVHSDIETVVVQQAVLSERLDNTTALRNEITVLRESVSELRLQLATIRKPDQQ